MPVIKKVDEYTLLDKRGVAILDTLENQAANAKDGITAVNTVARQPLEMRSKSTCRCRSSWRIPMR